ILSPKHAPNGSPLSPLVNSATIPSLYLTAHDETLHVHTANASDMLPSFEGLELNLGLDAVPLITMRKFAIRCQRFIDVYHKGLNGAQAAWAAKKF
ncbi:hypothetical protein PAXRUDRAFT_835248, partial [Paxillus rubicundulus Ve08.2h10]